VANGAHRALKPAWTIAADLRIVDDLRGLSGLLPRVRVNQATGTVRANGRFTVALSGGSTPKSLFSLLASTFPRPTTLGQNVFLLGRRAPRTARPPPIVTTAWLTKRCFLKFPYRQKMCFGFPQRTRTPARQPLTTSKTLRKFFELSPGTFRGLDLILLGMDPTATPRLSSWNQRVAGKIPPRRSELG